MFSKRNLRNHNPPSRRKLYTPRNLGTGCTVHRLKLEYMLATTGRLKGHPGAHMHATNRARSMYSTRSL